VKDLACGVQPVAPSAARFIGHVHTLAQPARGRDREKFIVSVQLISSETLSRLDRHRVTMRVLISELSHRAGQIEDARLQQLVSRLEAVEREQGHLLEAVLDALADDS
jgi:hypothetical protein